MPKKVNIRDLLHKSGLRATLSRLEVLEFIKKSSKPLSAQKVINAFKGRYDKVTIYRLFKNLREKGLIRQIDLRHNHAHYEFKDSEDHHHLVCIICDKIEDIHGCDIESFQKSILNTTHQFAEIRQHSLEFYGVCKKCIQVKTD